MDRIERGILLLVTALLVWQLFVPPVTGLANTGDFPKVIGLFNLGPPGLEWKWAPTVYRFDPSFHWWSGFYSSEILLTGIAIGLNGLLSKTGTFDLRLVGAVHGALYLVAVYLLFPLIREWRNWKRIALGALIAIIGCDAEYTLLYNTFYADAAAHLFFLLTLVLFLRTMRWLRPLDFAAFVLCSALFLTSKAQHAILGLPIAALALYTLARSGRRMWAGLAACSALLASAFSLLSTPAFYKVSGAYSTIFFVLLPSSKAVAGDLAALGLDDSYRRYIGTHGYSDGSGCGDPEFVRKFASRNPYLRLGWFYVTHPRRAYRILRTDLDDGGRQRPAGGNFDRAEGMPPDAESRSFSLWSGLKQLMFFHHGTRYLLCFIALAAAFVFFAYRAGAMLPATTFALIALLELLISTLADVLDPIRHLLLFSAMMDTMLICAVASVCAGIARRFDEKTNIATTSVSEMGSCGQ